MAPVHYDLFWQDYFDYCELDRLRGIFAQIDLTEVRREIRHHRNGKGAYSDINEQLFQIVNFDEKYTDSDNLNSDSNQNER